MVPNGNRNNNNDTGQVDSRLESLHSEGGGESGSYSMAMITI